MKIVVLVPRRADNGRRDQLWEYVKGRWVKEHPDWPIFEGHHDVQEGAFNRSAAINRAAEAAGDWDVAVIADSDGFVGSDQIEAAVATAVRTGQMTLAFDKFCYLNYEMSNAVMGGFNGDWSPGIEWTMTGTCSSMVVETRSLWDRCGGFDEGFSGWGGEDVGHSLAAQTFGNGLQRVVGNHWHLWHIPAVEKDRGWVDRIERYKPCAYNADAMTALLAELRAELVSG